MEVKHENRNDRQDADSSLKDAVVLLFSGGLDTTLEAIARLREYRDVHLVTFDNGYCINLGSGRRRADELREHFDGDRIHYTLVNTSTLMKIILREHRHLWEEIKSPLVFDLVCKMSALTELIYYAKLHGVTDISDGSAVEQTQIFLQHPEFTAHIKPCVTSYGLRWIRPVQFDMDRKSKLELLKKTGLKSGFSSLEKIHITSQLGHQPFCLRGIVTYFFTSPIRKLGPVKKMSLPVEQAKELWDRLIPVAKAFLDHRLLDLSSSPSAASQNAAPSSLTSRDRQ